RGGVCRVGDEVTLARQQRAELLRQARVVRAFIAEIVASARVAHCDPYARGPETAHCGCGTPRAPLPEESPATGAIEVWRAAPLPGRAARAARAQPAWQDSRGRRSGRRARAVGPPALP